MQSKSAINKIINETPDFEKMVNRIEVETLGNFLMNYSSDLSYIKAFHNWKTNGFKDSSYFDQEDFSLKNFLIEYKLLRFLKKEKQNELFIKISEYFIKQKEIDVVKFAKCLSERNEISMASKILFLHSPEKIIIYDKYAKIGIDFKGNSYELFVSKVTSNSHKYNETIIKLFGQIPKSICVIEKEILNIDCSKIRQNRLIDKLFWTMGKVIENQQKKL